MRPPDESSPTAVRLPRTLVVDDDPAMLRLVHRVFRKDLDMVLVDDPLRALALLEQESFDIALIDFTMPSLNGLALAQRGAVLRPAMGWLMLTAHDALPEVRAAAGQGHVDAMLAKPWNREEVLAEVARILQRRAGGARGA
jgi:DNA-binding NtrC family response regulator